MTLLISPLLAQSSQPDTQPATQPATQPVSARAAVLHIEGEITDYTAGQLERRIKKAKDAGADTLILHINTPGGGVGAALEMSRLLKRTSETMHTIAFVDPIAYSAGTMIAVACREIYMAPGGMIGDCAPIIMGPSGLQEITGAERAKMESPIVADFEDSAERNGYDPLLVRSFVQYQVVIHLIQNPQGERRFVYTEEYKRLINEGWTIVPGVKDPLDDESTLLTMNNTTAERIGFSRGTFDSVDSLARARGMTIVERYETTASEALLGLLNGAAVRGLLATVFLMTLYASFSHPGTGFPEVTALITGSLLLGVPLLTGYAGWLEIILIFVGIALLALEMFIIPGFGFAGITGLIMLLAGLVMSFVPSEAPGLPSGPSFTPQLQGTQTALKEGLIVVTTGLLASVGLWIWISRYLPKIPYANRLILTTTVGSTPGAGDDLTRDAVAAAWPAAGEQGIV
ncbi:MAG TPA: hypothetical protein VGB55_05070, partial [Tepidisphaeraceae bacterium]